MAILKAVPALGFAQNNAEGAQAVLVYNNVPLFVCRTVEYECVPESDFAGVDYLGINRTTIGVTAYVNPAATASLSGQAAPGFAGDRAGVTQANLERVLMQKRHQLLYRIGPDVVVKAPQSDAFVCDAKNGPEPLALKVLEVHGTKTALIYFRVRCWTGGDQADPTQNNIVLSNRWETRTSVDDDWKTTIRLSGRMRLRTDVLQNQFNVATPDIFRQSCLPLPVPLGFKRRVPLVRIVPDGTELEWQCVDEQQFLNLGASSSATRVEGQTTSGADVPWKDFKDLAHAAGKIVGSKGMIDMFWNMFDTFFPTVKNTFQLRVFGAPRANRQDLVEVGLQIILDRFAPQLQRGILFGNPFNVGGTLISLYLTTPISKGHIELRGAVLGTWGAAEFFNPVDWSGRMNIGDFTNSVQGGATLDWSYSNDRPNPDPPLANTSRGVFFGTLLEQALMGAYQLPVANLQAESADDLGFPFQ